MNENATTTILLALIVALLVCICAGVFIIAGAITGRGVVVPPTATPTHATPAAPTITAWPTPTQEIEPTPGPEPCRVEVMPGIHLNMREQPDTTSRIIMVLDPGITLDVFEERFTGEGRDTRHWYRVGGFGEERGWVSSAFVSRSGDCSWLE